MLSVLIDAVGQFIMGSVLGTKVGRCIVYVGAVAGLSLLLWLVFDAY